MRKDRSIPPVPEGSAWAALGVVSAGAAFFYVLMEWVFFATKPSFMSTLGGWERARILLLSPLPLAGASVAVCAALGAAARIAPRARGGMARAGALWPGLMLASAFFLMLDNFTYTLFRIGVQTSDGFWRFGYLGIFLLFWAWGWRLSMAMLRGVLAWRRPVRGTVLWAAALAALWGGLLATGSERAGGVLAGAEGAADEGRLPNIILFGSDGIGAEHLSLYGYERETTPIMRTFREGRTLVCENAFANSLNSGGSIASLLTGKQPTALRMYYPPEILTGRNAYEHLPGILRQHGYWNVDISARQFADAYDLNMLHSFHEANGRSEGGSRWQEAAAGILGMHTGYFLGATWERLRDRLLHAAGAQDFESAYEQVAGEAAGTEQDDEPRIGRLLRAIAECGDRPFFAHVHLMETHGPAFHLEHPVFSKGREQKEAFETDFYDDSILELDAAFGRIVGALKDAGQLDNTVLVLSTDHGKGWGSGRIPLVFWFPGGAHAGRIRTNAQNVDLAPTLLDYLGLPVPQWMEGVSLLDGDPPATRPIFLTAVDSRLVNPRKWLLDESRLKPPFFSLGSMGMRVGDRSYMLDLRTGELGMEPVPGHTHPLAEGEAPPEAEARRILLGHLEENGYEIPASLKKGDGRP